MIGYAYAARMSTIATDVHKPKRSHMLATGGRNDEANSNAGAGISLPLSQVPAATIT